MKKQTLNVPFGDNCFAIATLDVFQRRPFTIEIDNLAIMVTIQGIQFDLTDGFSKKELADFFEEEILHQASKKFDIDDFYEEYELIEMGFNEPDYMQLAKDHADWEQTHGKS